MTDRIKGFHVALKDNIREDDAEQIAKAICLLQGVVRVEPSVDGLGDHLNRMKVRQELGEKLFDILYPKDTIKK